MSNGMEAQGLSRGQQEFAERMDCGMVMRCVDRSVCLYRVIAHETIRWIVDVDGEVLDWAVFHSGCDALLSSSRGGEESSLRTAA